MEAELHSYPKEHHQGGNACQRIHPLCLLSTSTYDLKEGLVLALNTLAVFNIQMYCTLKQIDRVG